MINKLGEFTKEMKSLDDSLAHLKIDEVWGSFVNLTDYIIAIMFF